MCGRRSDAPAAHPAEPARLQTAQPWNPVSERRTDRLRKGTTMTDAPQPPHDPNAPGTPPREEPAAGPQQPAPQAAPPKQDLTMAWLPHLLLALTQFVGPLILWLIKKDDDKVAAFHSKQAMIMGIVPTIAGVLATILASTGVGCIVSCPLSLVPLAVFVYAIVGMVQALQGQPFKYYYVADQFCAKEFAEAYPHLAGGQQAQ
jgi:hypothetical protein